MRTPNIVFLASTLPLFGVFISFTSHVRVFSSFPEAICLQASTRNVNQRRCWTREHVPICQQRSKVSGECHAIIVWDYRGGIVGNCQGDSVLVESSPEKRRPVTAVIYFPALTFKIIIEGVYREEECHCSSLAFLKRAHNQSKDWIINVPLRCLLFFIQKISLFKTQAVLPTSFFFLTLLKLQVCCIINQRKIRIGISNVICLLKNSKASFLVKPTE